jgi:phage terminase large subunit
VGTGLAEALQHHPDLAPQGRSGVVRQGLASAAAILAATPSTGIAPERYQRDPIAWMHDRLHIPEEHVRWSKLPAYAGHTWDGDRDPLAKALEALADWKDVGVESGTATGKTIILGAATTLWFLDCFPEALVVTGAPKERQLELHLWKEIGRFWPRFQAYRPAARLLHLEIRMVPRADESGMAGWQAVGFPVGVGASEESATRAQGFHAEHMLIITEETPGIHAATMTAFEQTSQAPHNLRLALGNPDHAQDELHRFCQSPGVVAVRISALDHPNVVLDDPGYIPGAVSRAKLDDRLRKYGPENPLYLSRVRGLCPTDATDSLIRFSWLVAARDRQDVAELELQGPEAMGVDVANSEDGDKAAIARGRGARCREVREYRCPDANAFGRLQVAPEIGPDLDAGCVGVDGVGVGAGTVNELKRLGHVVQSLLGSAAPVPLPDQEERFLNLRSQMWWQAREDLRLGRLGVPADEELFADLTTPRWGLQKGKIVVESKDELKKRLGRSPNKGDAFVYWNWVRQRHVRWEAW